MSCVCVEGIRPVRINRQLELKSALPTAAQELLLRAALCDGGQAHEAFTAWKKSCGFAQYADVDFLSTYLLPCVYGNLARTGISDPWLPQLAGLHRYHWTRNAARKRTLLAVVERFHASGLEFVILGSFALWAGKYFNDLGERPFLDAELILSPSDASSARRLFAALGWRAATTTPPPVAGWRSEPWCGPDDQTLHVHFRWLPKSYPVVGIGRLLQYATIAEFGGVPLHIPDATDLLLQACVCSRRFQEDIGRQALWIADALRVLQRSGSQIDWERLWEESRRLCTLSPLRCALEYLRTALDAPVPETWLVRARQVNIPLAELHPFYRSIKHRTGFPAARPTLSRPWNGYVAAEQAAGRAPSAGGLFQYCAWRLSLRLKKATQFARKHATG
jgi:hypothetical protein